MSKPTTPADVIIGDDNRVYQYFLDHRYAPLAHKLIAFTTLIEEKTKNFIGRQFVFEAFDEFAGQSPSGYFIIKGEAGIGKSALDGAPRQDLRLRPPFRRGYPGHQPCRAVLGERLRAAHCPIRARPTGLAAAGGGSRQRLLEYPVG